jgi:alkyl sulfatase BDS1-like metallo-beta-lactamase superfamily hydrolase
VKRRFPRKTAKRVGNGLQPISIRGFLDGLSLVFQPNRSADLDATYHFTFTGEEKRQATVIISNKSVRVRDGHVGDADLLVTADSRTWLGFLAKERSLVWALLSRKIRIKGSPRLLQAFGRCFPS